MMSKIDLEALEAAHRRSIRHRQEIEASELCGCFYCETTFSPADITKWTDDGQTALCPRCGIDSVLAARPDVPATAPAFLRAMHERWFE